MAGPREDGAVAAVVERIIFEERNGVSGDVEGGDAGCGEQSVGLGEDPRYRGQVGVVERWGDAGFVEVSGAAVDNDARFEGAIGR